MNKGTIAITHFDAAGQEFWVVEIKCNLYTGVCLFSNAIDAHKFVTNEWRELVKKGCYLLLYPYLYVEAFNIVSRFIDAAYFQQGYLKSKIENHQLYITNGRQ